jgi:hypothetical protein
MGRNVPEAYEGLFPGVNHAVNATTPMSHGRAIRDLNTVCTVTSDSRPTSSGACGVEPMSLAKSSTSKSNMKIRHPETADVDLDDMETTTAATKADGVLAFVRSVSEVDENASEIVKAPSHRFAQEKIYAKTDRV